MGGITLPLAPVFSFHSLKIFLGLVAQDGMTPAKVPRNFRWVLGEYLDLPFEEYVCDPRQGLGSEKRRLQPDAMLEDPAGRRRYFIEYETGSATIRDAKKSTSTMAKLDRYGTFLRAPSDNLVAGQREAYYAHAFTDDWPAEVLFVTRSEGRRDSITRVIAERERSGKFKFTVRALTLAETHGGPLPRGLRSRPAAGKRFPRTTHHGGTAGAGSDLNRVPRAQRRGGASPPGPCLRSWRAADQVRETAAQRSRGSQQRGRVAAPISRSETVNR